MGKDFEILEHTSEVKIRAHGGTMAELFSNMMRGMMAVLSSKVAKGAGSVTQKVELSSLDSNSLLIDFLNEVLYLSQIHKETYDAVTFSFLGETELSAELSGKKVAAFKDDIKAATHHGVQIQKADDGTWGVEVIYDV